MSEPAIRIFGVRLADATLLGYASYPDCVASEFAGFACYGYAKAQHRFV